MKEIFIINSHKNNDLPVTKRIESYLYFFSQHGIHTEHEHRDKLYWLKLIYSCIFQEKILLISMPPFRGFWIFIIPKTKIILDIRDGWSIAMQSGYGNTSRKKTMKAKLARLVERFIIQKSWITITCTPGLQSYLTGIAKRNILLIPNGIDNQSYHTIQQITPHPRNKRDDNALIFCCAGKFSEYGKDKVKKLFLTILSRYENLNLLIELIGCDQNINHWTIDYMRNLSDGRARVEIRPRMQRTELLEKMALADYGISIVRDPNYEFGTKIYDYIALQLPVVNYFDKSNNFTDYFDACLDRPFCSNKKPPEIRREILIESALRPYIIDSSL